MGQLAMDINNDNELYYTFEINDGDAMSDSVTATSFEALKTKAIESLVEWIKSELDNNGNDIDSLWISGLEHVIAILERSTSIEDYTERLERCDNPFWDFKTNIYIEIDEE